MEISGRYSDQADRMASANVGRPVLTVTYGAASGLTLIHHLQGAHHHGGSSVLVAAFRSGTVALPVVLLAFVLVGSISRRSPTRPISAT